MPRRISSDDTNKRQPKGVGSVFQRSDGSWIAQITLENGKQKQYRAKTEKDANVKLRKALDELERGSLLTEKDQTLREYLEHWLENVKRPSLKVGSYLRYRILLTSKFSQHWDTTHYENSNQSIWKPSMPDFR